MDSLKHADGSTPRAFYIVDSLGRIVQQGQGAYLSTHIHT